jgi:hypothetical protein
MLQRAAARIGRTVSYRVIVSNFDSAFRVSDPVVQAVMAADAVDPAALGALLREAARKLDPDSLPSRSAGTRASHTGISAEAQAQAKSACAAA